MQRLHDPRDERVAAALVAFDALRRRVAKQLEADGRLPLKRYAIVPEEPLALGSHGRDVDARSAQQAHDGIHG